MKNGSWTFKVGKYSVHGAYMGMEYLRKNIYTTLPYFLLPPSLVFGDRHERQLHEFVPASECPEKIKKKDGPPTSYNWVYNSYN